MIHVPGDAAALLDGTPVLGSVEEVDAACGFAREAAVDAAQYAVAAENARIALAGQLSAAAERIREKIGRWLLPGSSRLARSAGAAERALGAYAAEVDRIHAEARRTAREVEEALASIRAQAARIEDMAAMIGVPAAYAWDSGAPGALPEPRLDSRARGLDDAQREAALGSLRALYEQPWLHAASGWHAALEEIARARRAWAQLIEDRRDAEGRLVRALGETTIGQLLSVGGDAPGALDFTIATAISGELRGVSEEAPLLATSHRLLPKLFGAESGEHSWDEPPDPERLAANWAALSAEERRRLIDEVPSVIGNLPGLPFEARDAANRRTVEFFQRHPQALSADQLRLMAGIRRIIEVEESEISRYGRGRPPIQLVALDLTGDVPRAAIGYGDLDTASRTTWQVPGMNSDAHLALEGWDRAGRNLHSAQRQVPGFRGSNAVVAWLGYDSPDSPQTGDLGVLATGSAEAGAARFAAELDGAHAARNAGACVPSQTHVVAHSYGTTLATIALTLIDEAHPVASLTMLGSAGLDTGLVPSLDALRVAEVSPGQKAVFTTHAAGDRLAPFGAGASRRGQPNPFARDPFGAYLHSAVYEGALSFSSEGDPARGLKRTDGHSTIGEGGAPGLAGISASEGHGYLDLETQSLGSVAQITTGRIGAELGASLRRSGERHFAVVSPLADPLGAFPRFGSFPVVRETLRYGGS